MTPVERAPRLYLIELGLAFLLYVAALLGRVYALKAGVAPAFATAVTVAPILPVLLIALAIYRFYRRMDEFHRIRLLKVAAVSCGLTAIATASWSFLTDVGAPPLQNYGVLLLLAGVFGLAGLLFRTEDAVADGRIGQPARWLTWLAAALVAVGGLWLGVAVLLGLPLTAPLCLAVPGAAVLVCVSLYLGPSAGIA